MSVLIHVKTLKTTTPLVWLQGLKRNNKYSMGDAWFKRYTSGLEPPRFPLPTINRPPVFLNDKQSGQFVGLFVIRPGNPYRCIWAYFNEP